MKINLLPAALALAVPSVALAHLHLTSEVVDGPAGPTLAFTTYGESCVTIDPSGRLLDDGAPLTYTLETGPIVGGAFDGYLTGAAPTLTTDLPAFAAAFPDPASRPDVQYELAAITPVNGAADNVIGYSIPADPAEGLPYQDAFTNGATLADRSLDYGFDEHLHGVSLYSLRPGLYDLTLLSRDANGLLAPGGPVTFRVSAVPEPASAGLLAAGCGALLLRRRRGGAGR